MAQRQGRLGHWLSETSGQKQNRCGCAVAPVPLLRCHADELVPLLAVYRQLLRMWAGPRRAHRPHQLPGPFLLGPGLSPWRGRGHGARLPGSGAPGAEPVCSAGCRRGPAGVRGLGGPGQWRDPGALVPAPRGRRAVLWGSGAAGGMRASPGKRGSWGSLEHCHRKERGWGSGLLRVSTECISFSS